MLPVHDKMAQLTYYALLSWVRDNRTRGLDFIIIYEHTMLVAGVFLSEKLKTCPMFQNRIKMTFSPEHMGLYQTEYNFNVIFLNKMLL